MLCLRPSTATRRTFDQGQNASLFNGDCRELLSEVPDESVSLTVTSPPYCMGKEYEPGNTIEDFIEAHKQVLPEIVRVTKPGGSICWQVGYHVKHNAVVPLDFLVYDLMRSVDPSVVLRNRIMWTFGHGLHTTNRFSGRHETILWFTKGRDFQFDLDAVRVPQKYPGKRASQGPNKGNLSGNPKGKNPTDVWDMPNVKANHVEKTSHPCQFPVALPLRLILALTKAEDVVLDPYAGTCSTGVAAVSEKRRFLGAELDAGYCEIGVGRLKEAAAGKARFRAMNKAVLVPSENSAVAKRPEHFATASQPTAIG